MLITSRILLQPEFPSNTLSNTKFLVPGVIIKPNKYCFILIFLYLKRFFLKKKEKHTPTSLYYCYSNPVYWVQRSNHTEVLNVNTKSR